MSGCPLVAIWSRAHHCGLKSLKKTLSTLIVTHDTYNSIQYNTIADDSKVPIAAVCNATEKLRWLEFHAMGASG